MKLGLVLTKYAKKNLDWGFILFAFLICLAPKLLGLASVLLVANILISDFEPKFFLKKISNFKTATPWMILFYLSHVVGLWNTQNMGFAQMDLGMKAVFILFPFAISFKKTPVQINQMLNAFTLGAIFSVIIAYILAMCQYTKTHNIQLSMLSDFSWPMHRSYWDAYLCIALTYLSFYMIQKRKFRFSFLLAIMLILAAIFITGSKMGILLIALSILCIVIYAIIETKKWKTIILLLLVLIGGTVILSNAFPSIKERFKVMLAELHQRKQIDITSTESNDARILMWRTATELIIEKPLFGVGTGDIKDALKQRNIEKGYTGVANTNLNAHNQLLNTQLALGILGSIFFIGMFLVGFIYVSDKQAYMIRWIIVVFIISMLVESYLETQAGILPVAFFLSIFSTIYSKRKISN
jgi:O-antigen ligase